MLRDICVSFIKTFFNFHYLTSLLKILFNKWIFYFKYSFDQYTEREFAKFQHLYKGHN